MFKNLIFALLPLLITCNFANAQGVTKLRIDPNQAYGGTVSDYFEEVSYIPLETTKESLFGDIRELVITDSSYIISDIDTRSVLFFMKNGSYITKIKFKNDDYPFITFLQSANSVIISVYSRQTKKSNLQYYSITGKKIEKSLAIKTDEKKMRMWPLEKDFYVSIEDCYFPPGKIPTDSTIYTVAVYKNDSVYKKFLPYNRAQTPTPCVLGATSSLSIISAESAAYIATCFDYDIYRLTKDTLEKIYKMIFPQNRVLSKDLLETKALNRIDSLRDNIYKSEYLIRGISNLFFEGNLFFFKIDQATYIWRIGSESEKQYNMVYNLKTGRLSSMERITPDEKTHYLPLMGGMYTSMRGFQYKQGYLYGSIPSLYMFTAMEKAKDKNQNYPAALQVYFKNEDRKSNPVLVQLKIKK